MHRRASGILLHITSLPSPHGIGDLGRAAYRFADFLSAGRQGYWQILPLNATSAPRGDSPYSSFSAFGGNPLLISLSSLAEEGLLAKPDLKTIPAGGEKRVDYPAVRRHKAALLRRAFGNFRRERGRDWEFQSFCHEQAFWLEDHALFVALRDLLGPRFWSRWPKEIRDRKRDALGRMERRLSEEIEREKFLQFIFYRQWFALKTYCHRKGVQVIGDMPIYVDDDSVEVWAHPENFILDENKRPRVVAGIPPDYFSATGQLWGNPIYRWDSMREKGYPWWRMRMGHVLKLYDWVRLDHFKGFVDFWEVPARDRTAVNGRWQKGPGKSFFNALFRHFPSLPLIAEDLGVITPEVEELRDRFGFPGMRVLQFAFGNDPLADQYKPLNYLPHCVAYTGTHDNDTLRGWLLGSRDHSTRRAEEIRRERRNALAYLGFSGEKRKDLHWEMIRLLMQSVARLVIFPMQDLLGLGGEGRMNRPAVARGNWQWRLSPGDLKPPLSGRLRRMTEMYERGWDPAE